MCLAACSGGQDSGRYEMLCSLILDENSDWYKGMARWKELVEQRSKGRVRMTIHTRASLASGNQRTERDFLRQGVLHAVLQSNLLLYDLDHRWGVFSLPWLFPDYKTANAVCDGPVGQEMLAALEHSGITGLAFGVNGFRQLTNNKRPIESLDDMKGLNVRVPGAMYIPIFRAMGADPSQMSFGELFLALRQGAMDGQENPVSVILSSRLYEVQPYLTKWDYSFDCLVLCVNTEFFRKLPADLQELLRQCAKEAMAYQRAAVEESERRGLDALKNKGVKVTTLAPDALGRFKAAMATLDDDFAKDFGEDLVRRCRAAAAKAVSGPAQQ